MLASVFLTLSGCAELRVPSPASPLAKVYLFPGEKVLVSGASRTLYKFRVTAAGQDLALEKFTFSVSPSAAKSSQAETYMFSLYVFVDPSMSLFDSRFAAGLVNAGRCYEERADDKNVSIGKPFAGMGAGSKLVEIRPNLAGCKMSPATLVIPRGESRWFKFAADIGPLSPNGISEEIYTQLESIEGLPPAYLPPERLSK